MTTKIRISDNATMLITKDNEIEISVTSNVFVERGIIEDVSIILTPEEIESIYKNYLDYYHRSKRN